METKKQKSKSTIRTIYLYLFSIIGLVLLIIGSVGILDLALKSWVFTQAEAEEKMYSIQPPQTWMLDKVNSLSNNEDLTTEEHEAISRWLDDYKTWEEKNKNFDPVKSRRQSQAATNIAMILIGLPLYLFHWGIIRKETKN